MAEAPDVLAALPEQYRVWVNLGLLFCTVTGGAAVYFRTKWGTPAPVAPAHDHGHAIADFTESKFVASLVDMVERMVKASELMAESHERLMGLFEKEMREREIEREVEKRLRDR